MKKIFPLIPVLFFIVSFSFPLLVAAQTTPCATGSGTSGSTGSSGSINTSYLSGFLQNIKTIINEDLVPVLMAIAFIVFLWGVYRYFILGAADEGKRAEGRQFVLWGVIGFVVILSLWGLVSVVQTTLGLTSTGAPCAPTI